MRPEAKSSHLSCGALLYWFAIFFALPFASTLFIPLVTYADVPLTCGQMVSATTNSSTQVDRYAFTANAGDTVRIVVAKVSGSTYFGTPAMVLYDPSQTAISTSTSGTIEKALTASGDYTIRVYDNGYDGTGTYQIRWDKLNSPCAGKIALPNGQPITGTTNARVQEDYYTFTAAAGDTVRIVASTVSGGSYFTQALALYDPSGVVIATAGGAFSPSIIDKALTMSGDYTVRLSDYSYDATGAYQIQWNKPNNPSGGKIALLCGQPATGTTTSNMQEHYYTFTAAAGDTVRIVASTVSGGSYFTQALALYDPSGVVIATAGGAFSPSVIDKALTMSGDYTVRVSDNSYDATGTYKVTRVKSNNPCNAVTMTCGQSRLGSISSSVEYDFYTFTADASDAAAFTMTTASGSLSPQLELFNNSGTKLTGVFSTTTGTVTLNYTFPSAGTYSIAATDYNYDGTGNYKVTFQKNNNSCPATFIITATSNTGGSISPTGDVTANQGANQNFTIVPNTGYNIADVQVDGASVGLVSAYTFTNVTGPHTITANFIKTYDITATANSNGSISPSGIVSLNSGTTQIYMITPNTGYHVADVQIDGASVGPVNSYAFTNITADHTITASFAINTYTITVTTNGGGTVSPSGTITLNYGTNQTFTITPNVGSPIADVIADGVSVGIVNTYTFTNVTANHSILASFGVSSGGDKLQYFYDDAGRLTRVVNGNDGRKYQYDEVGNLVSITTGTQ